MEAGRKKLSDFIKSQIKMTIPIYQRKYNWSVEECKQLFNDIETVGKNETRKTYFIGSIVIKREGDDLTDDLTEVLLIDGQQRMTTITLIYCALCDYYKDIDAKLHRNIHSNYLVNNDLDETIKLQLIKSDNEALHYIINSLILDKEFNLDPELSVNIYNNYNYFKKQINEDNVEIIMRGLRKLIFISIRLDPEDNPQLIFESLNSTGLDLNKNDLIRNYILMNQDAEKQKKLYENYWYEIEEGFVNEDKLFDYFIRYYLSIKSENGNLPTFKHLYKDFKRYAEFKDVTELVKDISKFANYFFNIKFEKEPDPDLLKAFKSFNKLELNMPLPFLLEAYDDYKNADKNPEINLTKSDFISIINYVESYCLRRNICGIDNRTMDKFFAKLAKEIDKKDYLNHFIAIILTEKDKTRFPTNEEIKETLITQDMYSKQSIKHILMSIEESHNKEVLNIDKCTIEHIMPRKITNAWINDLGENYQEIHEKYLHTIGNLTLTPHNSELGVKSFEEKKHYPEYGFEDSKMFLSKELCKLDKWNDKTIIYRANQLANEIINMWAFPIQTDEITAIIDSINKKDDVQIYTLDDFYELEERTLTRQLFDLLDMWILKLDSKIEKSINKQYIAYKQNKNFVEIVPLKSGLKLSLDIPISELNDSKNKCEDISYKGRWGTGQTRVYLKKEYDINYIMDLIKQSYEYNL